MILICCKVMYTLSPMSCTFECRATAFGQNVRVQGVHAFGNSSHDLLHEGKLAKSTLWWTLLS